MLTPDEILNLFEERKKYYAPLHAGMRKVQDIYEGRTVIHLPDMDKTDAAAVPNLLAQGIDQMAARIAQTVPQIGFAAGKPGVEKEERRAREAAHVISGWWYAERFKAKQAIRARHLVGLSMSPCVVRWDKDQHRPIREVRKPQECYPNPETVNGTSLPLDVIFAYKRTVGFLKRCGYGAQVARMADNSTYATIANDDEMTVVEYIDYDGRMVLLTAGVTKQLIGGGGMWESQSLVSSADRYALLEWAPMKDPYCTVSVPTRITLDRPSGQFDGMVAMYYHHAKLMMLHVAATEKEVFPDTYLVSRPGELARFIEGPYDGRTGMVNIIAGGTVESMSGAPGYQTSQVIDRYERAERLTAGLPQEFGGESGTNIRTGRRGDAVLSAVIDFPIAEAQDCFAYALEDENRVAIALAKMYDGNAERTVYVGEGNETRTIVYVANKVFQTSQHKVTYPVTGADVNNMMIGVEQRVGAGLMSKKTAMTLDPWVSNPEYEHDRTIYEALEQAALSGIQQQAAAPPGQGGLPLSAILQVANYVQTDKMEILDALNKVIADAQQAAQAPPAPGAPALPPGQATPEAAAAATTAGALTGSPVPGAEPGQKDLASLFNQLRTPGKVEARSGQAA